MSPFEQNKSDADLIRPSESIQPRERLRVLYGAAGRAHITGDTTDVVVGDVLARHLPNGNLVHHRVDAVVIYPGGPLANIELDITVCPAPRASEPVAAGG